MPNWCEGQLRVRGTYENVKRFCLENLYKNDKPPTIACDEPGNCFELVDEGKYYDYDWSLGYGWWNRTFVNLSMGAIFERYARCRKGVIVFQLQSAWDIKEEILLELCQKYNLDMRIVAYEMGQQFSHEVEIIGGKLRKNKIRHYKDYDWDCPFPLLGG